MTTPNADLLATVYSFLIKNGLDSSAKSLIKEAKLNEKSLKTTKTADLTDIYTSFKSQK